MKQRVFIGSSSEKLHIARAIESNLARDHEPTVWDEGILELSKDTLSGLIDRLDVADAAVFVLAPDDVTQLRQQTVDVARDNVVFELGLFIGRLGRERTYFVVPRGQAKLHLPSDLLGLVAAEYDPARSDGNWEASVSPACSRIRAALQKLTERKPPMDRRLDILTAGLDWMQDYVNQSLKSLLTEEEQPSVSSRGITVTEDNCHISIGRTRVCVRFGDIGSCDSKEPGAVVALPANEFFDDECIRDTRSALGAYMESAFPDAIEDIQKLIAQKLANAPCELVEREHNERAPSYGVAKCVLLKNPLASGRNLMIVSVTTKRAGVGLRSEARYLFAAMKAICQEMNDGRLTDLYLPLMGAGHGGLEPELALLYLLLSTKAVLDDRLGGHLRSVTIVVYRRDARTAPSIHPDVVSRMLSVVKRTA
ncbi:MAG: TIR domain-containing protein [Thermoanaerobaculia bacterium]